jgi:hypothetical protein
MMLDELMRRIRDEDPTLVKVKIIPYHSHPHLPNAGRIEQLPESQTRDGYATFGMRTTERLTFQTFRHLRLTNV